VTKYLRGRAKLELIRDLAADESSIPELAAKYGRSVSGVKQLKARHLTEILAIRQRAANELVGLWIADKVNRVAEYEADVEAVNDALRADGLDPNLLRAKHRALRSVAEELGALPTRPAVVVDSVHVTYTVEGIDPEALR
jgi:hypothetical protein